MRATFGTLLQKDFIELSRNRLMLLFVLCLSGAIVTVHLAGYRFEQGMYYSLILFIVIQHSFDSYHNDIQSGSALFLINARTGFFRLQLSRTLFSIVLSSPLVVVSMVLHDAIHESVVHDSLLLVTGIVLSVHVTFFAVVVTSKSNSLSFFLSSTFVLGLYYGMTTIEQQWVQYGAQLSLIISFFLVDRILYRSTRYRVLL